MNIRQWMEGDKRGKIFSSCIILSWRIDSVASLLPNSVRQLVHCLELTLHRFFRSRGRFAIPSSPSMTFSIAEIVLLKPQSRFDWAIGLIGWEKLFTSFGALQMTFRYMPAERKQRKK